VALKNVAQFLLPIGGVRLGQNQIVPVYEREYTDQEKADIAMWVQKGYLEDDAPAPKVSVFVDEGLVPEAEVDPVIAAEAAEPAEVEDVVETEVEAEVVVVEAEVVEAEPKKRRTRKKKDAE